MSMWFGILKSKVYEEGGELEVSWNSKDGKAEGDAFYCGYWGIIGFGHNAEEGKGLGEKYLKEMIEYLHSIKEGDIEADGTLPEADGFWNKMLSKKIIQSIRRSGE